MDLTDLTAVPVDFLGGLAGVSYFALFAESTAGVVCLATAEL